MYIIFICGRFLVAVSSPIRPTPGFPLPWYSPGLGEAVNIIIIIIIVIILVAVSSPHFGVPGFPLLWYSPGGGEAVYIKFRPYIRCFLRLCPGQRITCKGSFLTIGSLATPSFFMTRVFPPYIRRIVSLASLPSSIRAIFPPAPSFRGIFPSIRAVVSSIIVSSLIVSIFSAGSFPS